MKPASSAAAEPVAPVDRLCSFTAMVVLLCEFDNLFSAPCGSDRDLSPAVGWGAGSTSTPTCVIALPPASGTGDLAKHAVAAGWRILRTDSK